MLFVCQPSVLCDSIEFSDSNETSNTLCTLLRLTCHHRYFVSQRIDRSAVLQIIRIFLPDLLSSQESCFCVTRHNYVRYLLPQACDSVLHSTDNG
jgi:hypothetical protein